jgi:hypothetical protein
MLENAVYFVAPPEFAASLTWRNPEQKHLAAKAMRVSTPEILELGCAGHPPRRILIREEPKVPGPNADRPIEAHHGKHHALAGEQHADRRPRQYWKRSDLPRLDLGPNPQQIPNLIAQRTSQPGGLNSTTSAELDLRSRTYE